MAEEAPQEQPAEESSEAKDPLALRYLKAMARVDWKLLLLLSTTAATVGNRALDVIEKAVTERTQAGAYEILASRLDDMAQRVEELEHSRFIQVVPLPPTPTQARIERRPASTPAPEPVASEPLPPPSPGHTAVSEPVDGGGWQFHAARLPSFGTLQRWVVSGEGPTGEVVQMMGQEPAKAEEQPQSAPTILGDPANE